MKSNFLWVLNNAFFYFNKFKIIGGNKKGFSQREAFFLKIK